MVLLVTLATLACGLATIAGFAGATMWQLDLFAHFRVQYMFVLFVCALSSAILRRWAWALISSCLLMANTVLAVPLWAVAPAQAAANKSTLRIVSFNRERPPER